MNIAIIPARGGSKRIPKKNVKLFSGKPIIAYSILAAKESGLFDTVMVSTDSKEIAEIAISYGADIPFLRSDQSASDSSILRDVLDEVLGRYNKLNMQFDNVCCILPTAPLLETRDLAESYKILCNSSYNSVVPVVRYSYTIFRSLKIEDGLLKMIWPENYTKRSQDLIDAYHDAGMFYWYKDAFFAERNNGFGSKTAPYIIDEDKAQDIDTDQDWEIAEKKYKWRNNV